MVGGYIGGASIQAQGALNGVLTLEDLAELRRDGVAFTQKQVFSTPGSNSFVVPAGITLMLSKQWGAASSGSASDASFDGGDGAPGSYLEAFMAVTPGETLTIITGQRGNKANGQTGGAATTLGYGAGSVTAAIAGGASGADLSGIKRGATWLTIASGAGGPGGASNTAAGKDGGGGDCAGQGAPVTTGVGSRGHPGSQNDVGACASVNTPPSGNNGGPGYGSIGLRGSGGGGGGGLYGGGGGCYGDTGGAAAGGGAGGSSYHDQATTVLRKFIPGTATPNTGDVDYIVGVSVPGTGATAGNNNATDGGDGLVVLYW